MKITIEKASIKKTKSGKDYLSVEAKEGRLSCWDNFRTLWPKLMELGEQDVIIEEKNGYGNIVGVGGEPKRFVFTPKDDRSQQIKEAQERKEESITRFNATNAAISLICHHPAYSTLTDINEIKHEIEEWRNYFIQLNQHE